LPDVISLIVAASANNVIGVRGELPWRLSDDLRRFKQVTMGKPIVMGRKTWASIGKALPGRQNIVLTRRSDFSAPGCDVVASKDEAVAAAGKADELMIIGGGQVYDLFLPDADRIYLTRVHTNVAGDAFFAVPGALDWRLVTDERHAADERNEFDYSFRLYERTGRS
jgi:dihydrofolate reductase